MNARTLIEETILRYPIFEYCFGSERELPFSEQIPQICARDCPHYGKSWACPPYAGSLASAKKRCGRYDSYCLFSTLSQPDLTWGDEAALHVRKEHERITRGIRRDLMKKMPDCLFFSTGCDQCDVCSCPDHPCRFPDEILNPIESQGILALELAEKNGLTLSLDSETIVYFSLILFHEDSYEDQNQ